MQVSVEVNCHPQAFAALIPPAKLDLYHQADVMNLMADRWMSVLVTDGARALAGCFEPRPIGDTGLYDIEPAMGYAPPVTNDADPVFLAEALAAYSAALRAENVIAELIRFNPVLQDHRSFEGQAALTVIQAKQVAICRCLNDPQAVVADFSTSRRKLISRTWDRFDSRILDPVTEMEHFRSLYEQSVARLGAGPRWLFDDRFYGGLARNPRYGLVGVWSADRLLAACVIGCAAPVAHYVIAASTEDYVEGAGERLILEAVLESARRGCGRLILGGGVTSAPDDGLLTFKSRFASATTLFHIGKMVHDPVNYGRLREEAIARAPALAASRQLLLYRDA